MNDFAEVLVSGLSPYVEQKGFPGMGTDYFTTSAVPGAAQKRNSSGMHTILIDTSSVTGNISFEATLDAELNSATFVPVNIVKILDQSVTNIVQLDDTTGNIFYNLAGKYTWIRAQITDFTGGTLNSIRMKIY